MRKRVSQKFFGTNEDKMVRKVNKNVILTLFIDQYCKACKHFLEGLGDQGMDVLLYLITKYFEIFKKPLDGRKKLQKLLFLVEHFDPDRELVTKSSGYTGYTFRIWMYGPFSKKIYQDLRKLKGKDLIQEEKKTWKDDPWLSVYIDDGSPREMFYYTPKISSRDVRIPLSVMEKINKILEKYGNKSPMELEQFVNQKLDLTPIKKLEYWGKTIDEYLGAVGFPLG